MVPGRKILYDTWHLSGSKKKQTSPINHPKKKKKRRERAAGRGAGRRAAPLGSRGWPPARGQGGACRVRIAAGGRGRAATLATVTTAVAAPSAAADTLRRHRQRDGEGRESVKGRRLYLRRRRPPHPTMAVGPRPRRREIGPVRAPVRDGRQRQGGRAGCRWCGGLAGKAWHRRGHRARRTRGRMGRYCEGVLAYDTASVHR